MKNKSTAGKVSTSSNSNNINVLASPNTKALLSGNKSFDWIAFLSNPSNSEVHCVPVSSFKHAPLSDVWDDLVTLALKVEVKNTDCNLEQYQTGSGILSEAYWIASVVRFAGYYVLLRYEGFGNDSSKDFWVNIFTSAIHPVGWCASQGKTLIPPASVEGKSNDWKGFLLKRLTGSRTLPENFLDQLKESIKSKFTVGMRLEVVDKRRISAVRVAAVDSIIGGRLHIKYDQTGEDELEDAGFWCHQFSPLIHPIGWAQLVGHELKATEEYATESLSKAVNNSFDAQDATWTLFPPIKGPSTALMNSNASNISNNHHLMPLNNGQNNTLSFKEGMKLEAIDPLNLSTICVATVMKVLRSNYLMIGIDGMMSEDGSDWFCYHASSPCIFPVGFCKINNIDLTPPKDWEDNFDWTKYLKETKTQAAPVALFKKDIPGHSFKEGHYLEAVDLMEPRLVCVASVKRVVGRLLRIHFDGWDDTYDQWCDCESPELFPIGWCHLVGYPLEPPKDNSTASDSSKKKRGGYKRLGRKGKKHLSKLIKDKTEGDASQSKGLFDSSAEPEEDEEMDVDNNGQTSSSKTSTSSRQIFHNRATDNTPLQLNPSVSRAGPSTKGREASSSSTPSRPAVSVLSNSSVVMKPSPPQPVLPCDRSRETDPFKWNVADVAHFLESNSHGSYVNSFVRKVCIITEKSLLTSFQMSS